MMNDKELKIISCLRGDARTSLSVISSYAGMPISTVYDKITKFQKEEVIQKYTTIIDFAKLGFNYRMLISLKVEPEDKIKLFSYLNGHACINTFHEINHGFDFHIETVHKNVKDYLNFISDLRCNFKIKEIHEYQIISEVKTHQFLR